VRLVFFEEKANAIFRSKKERNPAAQSCREAKNLQLCVAGIFYFGPFRVALDLRVDAVNEIHQPNHPCDVPGLCMSHILEAAMCHFLTVIIAVLYISALCMSHITIVPH